MFYTVIWSSVSSRLCELLPAIGPEIVKILGVHEGEDDYVFQGLTLYRPIGSVLKLETICFFLKQLYLPTSIHGARRNTNAMPHLRHWLLGSPDKAL